MDLLSLWPLCLPDAPCHHSHSDIHRLLARGCGGRVRPEPRRLTLTSSISLAARRARSSGLGAFRIWSTGRRCAEKRFGSLGPYAMRPPPGQTPRIRTCGRDAGPQQSAPGRADEGHNNLATTKRHPGRFPSDGRDRRLEIERMANLYRLSPTSIPVPLQFAEAGRHAGVRPIPEHGHVPPSARLFEQHPIVFALSQLHIADTGEVATRRASTGDKPGIDPGSAPHNPLLYLIPPCASLFFFFLLFFDLCGKAAGVSRRR